MPRMIFLNPPVADFARAMAFYQAPGLNNEARVTNGSAACMDLTETILVMRLTHAKWQTLTDLPIPGKGSNELISAIGCDSREEVKRLTVLSGTNGGIAAVNPSQDHGFMRNRCFADPDRDVRKAKWMDPAFTSSEALFVEARS